MSGAPDMVRGQMTQDGSARRTSSDDRHITFRNCSTMTAAIRSTRIGGLNETIAVMQYTGGTTGLPKGAMLTHANLSAACCQYVESTRTRTAGLDEGKERVLACCRPSTFMR